MLIDWSHFTPWSALAGGLLIGTTAALLILLNGRIAGVCGILGDLLRFKIGDTIWRIAFLGGLIISPLVWQQFAPLPQVRIDAGTGLLAAAGLIVGIGTRYGAGCTSGHGVCGIARLSPRSIIATLVFMGAGFATVFIARHLI